VAVPLGRRVLREVGGAGATLSLRGPKVAKVENFGKVGTVDASLTKNALARAAFFNRLGEMRGRSSKNQRYRASGLTMVLAPIILWNTVYLSCAIDDLKAQGVPVDDNLLEHLSPLGWEHINLTGDTSGVRTGVWKVANLDLSDPFPFLNVRFFPFRRDVRR
jgi:Tn3 transposase DDE domain-containing protein